MTNDDPIKHVATSDIGRRVSYQITGMPEPRCGTITWIATEVPDSTFVLFDGETWSTVTRLYCMRWGEVSGWL